MGTTVKSPTVSSDIRDIADFLRKLIKEDRDDEAIDLVIELLEAVRSKNIALELKVQKLLKQHYGRKSEGISKEQLSLFLSQLSDKESEDAKLPDDEDLESETEVKAHKRRKKGRRPLPDDIAKVQHKHLVEGDQRICKNCDEEMQTIGFDVRKMLDFEPARFVLHEHHDEKVACKKCQAGVVSAKGPAKVIEGGIPGAGLLAEIIVNKYRDALPLYRQIQRFGRLGLDFAHSTIVGWVAYTASELLPIVNLLKKEVMGAFVLATDGTGLPVLDLGHPKHIKKGTLLCHIGDDGFGRTPGCSKAMFFAYVPNQSKEGPQSILLEREGYIVLDAAGIYDGLFDGPESKAIEVGCMMHFRRYVFKAFDLGDLRAGIALKYIKRLYKIEKKAKREGMSVQQIEEIRLSKSKPVIEALKEWIGKMYKVEPPKTPLYRALTYGINQWTALNRFIVDGRLPIDNGEVERAIRSVAIGRKNYLFAGSDAGGERAAIFYTILGSCTLAGVNPWEYLRDVLDKIANGWPNSRLDELLPAKWKAMSESMKAVA